MASNSALAVGLLDESAARDDGLCQRLADLINDVYAVAERGLWQNGAGRTTPTEIRDLVAAGEIAVATASDGPIVGCVRVRQAESDADEFGMLVAAPDRRGTGIGRALLDFVERCARDRGRRAVRLELLVPRHGSHPDKEFLKAWYGRRGYRRIGTRRMDETYPHLAPFLAVPCDLLIYEKELPDGSSGPAAADLAYRFAESGPDGNEDDLARFVRVAERLGADPALGAIVLDRGAAPVVRQRAFGALHQQVERLARRALDPAAATGAPQACLLPA